MFTTVRTMRAPEESARAFVYRVLSLYIREMFLRPGEKLVETDVAQALQVSRTPVHDTFARLEREKRAGAALLCSSFMILSSDSFALGKEEMPKGRHREKRPFYSIKRTRRENATRFDKKFLKRQRWAGGASLYYYSYPAGQFWTAPE